MHNPADRKSMFNTCKNFLQKSIVKNLPRTLEHLKGSSADFSARTAAKSSVRGMTLGSLVFGIAIISFVGLMAVKCIPAFTEYMTVKRIVNQLEQSSETEVKVLKDNFSKRASIEYVTSVTVQDLTFARNGSSWTISFDYEKRIPIAGNASLVFQFTN